MQAPDTPFVSRSYMFMNNPFTHTGVWAMTPLNDTWSVGNGVVTGAATTFIDPANRPTYIGQIKWAPKDGDSSRRSSTPCITDPSYNAPESFAFYNVYDMVLTPRWARR